MRSLFWKLFLTMWLSIVGFSAAIGWMNDKLAREQWAEAPANTFHRGMVRISQRAQQAMMVEGRKGLRDELLSIPRMTRSYIYILDENGEEVLGRNAVLEDMLERRATMETAEFEGSDGLDYTIYTVNRSPPSTILAPGPAGTALRLLAAALISAFISFFLARSLVNPLEELRRASRKIADGELSTRVSPSIPERRDEIGQLAIDFDAMASRLQAMQEANRRLLQDVSHELRSPLARMSVALEIARKKGPGAVSGEIERLSLESQRLESLVNDVLGLLRESSETVAKMEEPIDLSGLLTDLVEVVNYEVPEDCVGIQWREQAPCPFFGDRELLWRAFENLLRNALRYTEPAKGVLLTLESDRRRDQVRISVRDYGPGVPGHELVKIMEPFYRVQESRDRGSGGHGLGLSIASNAVRRHSGNIRAINAEGGGLEVQVTMPLNNTPV